MQNYAERTTAELIDLLFQEEDRVTEDHIVTLAGRGEEAVARMREILANEDYWYEGQGGDHYIVVHAMTVLGLTHDTASLPQMLEMLEHSYFANHDASNEAYPPLLEALADPAHAGEAGLQQLMDYITRMRGAHRDNQEYGNCRHDAASAVARIGLSHDSLHERIRDFFLGLYADPAEDDYVFLSLSVAYPYFLGREQGVRALKTAFDRRHITPQIAGSYHEMMTGLQNPGSGFYHDLHTELLDFYQPEQMEERAKARAAEAEKKLYWGFDDASVPKGYAVAESGAVIRTEKVGRNDPCPCGSGKKYKKCCGANG
jgi:SEC-C motif